MSKILVNLKASLLGEPTSWFSLISYLEDGENNEDQVENVQGRTYSSKEHAWEQIKHQVEEIDYHENDVIFNGNRVDNYNDIEAILNTL